MAVGEYRSEAFPGQPGCRFRVDRRPGYFVPHVALLLIAGCFGSGAADSRGADQVVLVVITAVLTVPFVAALWLTLPGWNDQLTIYHDGFENRRRGRVSHYRWRDVVDVGEELRSGRRLAVSSITLSSGETLRFAYRMRGLDLLSQEYADHTQPDDPEPDDPEPDDPEPEVDLGGRRATYRVRRRWGGVFVAAVLGVLAATMLLYAVTEPDVGSFACSGVLGGAAFLVVRMRTAARHDELTVYDNGFTYRSRKGTQQCLWSQIEDYSTIRGSLVGLKKVDGPWITFAGSMDGIDELAPHARTLVRRVDRPDETVTPEAP